MIRDFVTSSSKGTRTSDGSTYPCMTDNEVHRNIHAKSHNHVEFRLVASVITSLDLRCHWQISFVVARGIIKNSLHGDGGVRPILSGENSDQDAWIDTTVSQYDTHPMVLPAPESIRAISSVTGLLDSSPPDREWGWGLQCGRSERQ